MEEISSNVRDIDAADREAVAGLPPWCNVYEGLTHEEIDGIEKSIVRSPGGRSFE